jgi:hypothetical protein
VHLRQVDGTKVPGEFADQEGFTFWASDDDDSSTDRPLGLFGSEEPRLVRKIVDLSYRIKERATLLNTTASLPEQACQSAA